MTTSYYLVYLDERDPPDQPIALYRRQRDDDARLVADESYHPRTGWSPTDYWLRTARGEPDRHLVEVDEGRAVEAQQAFLAMHGDGLR